MTEEKEFTENQKRAIRCHEAVIEQIIAMYIKTVTSLLEDEGLALSDLVGTHTTSGHVTCPGLTIGIPHEFTVKFGEPREVEDLLREQKEKFPGVPVRKLDLDGGFKSTSDIIKEIAEQCDREFSEACDEAMKEAMQHTEENEK